MLRKSMYDFWVEAICQAMPPQRWKLSARLFTVGVVALSFATTHMEGKNQEDSQRERLKFPFSWRPKRGWVPEWIRCWPELSRNLPLHVFIWKQGITHLCMKLVIGPLPMKCSDPHYGSYQQIQTIPLKERQKQIYGTNSDIHQGQQMLCTSIFRTIYPLRVKYICLFLDWWTT